MRQNLLGGPIPIAWVGIVAILLAGSPAASAQVECAADAALNEQLQDKGTQSYEKAEGAAVEVTVSGGIRKAFNVSVSATQGDQKIVFLDKDGKEIAGAGGNVPEGTKKEFEIPEDAIKFKITKTGPANGQNFKGKYGFVKKCSAGRSVPTLPGWGLGLAGAGLLGLGVAVSRRRKP
jgi:hypothetical protein